MADTTNYVVLKEAKNGEEAEALLAKGARIWVEIANGPAERNTDAIARATQDWTDEEKSGTYAAPSQRNFPVIPREIRTKVVDEFGEPSTTGSRKSRSASKQPPASERQPAGASA